MGIVWIVDVCEFCKNESPEPREYLSDVVEPLSIM